MYIHHHKFYLLLVSLLLLVACSKTPTLQPLSPDATILAFGDSLTFGEGATQDTNYPAVLQKLTGLKVINAGASGDETSDGIKRLPALLETNKPALVILELGGNDLLRKRNPESIADNLRQMIKTIQATGAQVILVSVPQPPYGLSAPEFYANLGKEFNIPVDRALEKLLRDPQSKSDAIHLNEQGYYQLAQNIAELMIKTGAIPSK
jgi:lysophospholipase L1-like esterase